MRNRVAATLLLFTSVAVLYRAAASFLHRHYSSDWQFARGQAFLQGYDSVYTFGPILTLAIVAWGLSRQSPGLIAYGLVLLLAVLVGPFVISIRVFPEQSVLSWWLSDASFLGATVLTLASLLATSCRIFKSSRAAA